MDRIKKLLIILALVTLILLSIPVNKKSNDAIPTASAATELVEEEPLEEVFVVSPEDETTTIEEEQPTAVDEVIEEQPELLSAPQPQYSDSDLMLLAKVIYAEAGSEFLSDEWKMCVGEVVLNRVASPEFPNTIYEVVYQQGQYQGARSGYIASLTPSERCINIARRLLNGERLMEPAVVFQANFKQGSGVCKALYDSNLGWTYFCYSSNMNLY